MHQNDFIRGAAGLCKIAANQGFVPVQSAIGDGLLIVQDTHDEYDVYFDMDRWEYTYPTIWVGIISDNGVGLLPGAGKFPQVRGFDEAVQFASRHLKSKKCEVRIYDQKPPMTPFPTSEFATQASGEDD